MNWTINGESRNLRPSVAYSGIRKIENAEVIALLQLVNDIFTALDNGQICILTLLDLSAAFETTDHDIRIRLLKLVFEWYMYYIVRFILAQVESLRNNSNLAPAWSDVPASRFLVPQGYIFVSASLSLSVCLSVSLSLWTILFGLNEAYSNIVRINLANNKFREHKSNVYVSIRLFCLFSHPLFQLSKISTQLCNAHPLATIRSGRTYVHPWIKSLIKSCQVKYFFIPFEGTLTWVTHK